MKKVIKFIICLLILAGTERVLAQSASEETQPSIGVQKQLETKKRVTAVYGVTADDYLPTNEYSAEDYLDPQIRKLGSHPGFDLPTVFYVIGGPIFVLILLRVLVIFINDFEEQRKEEGK